MSNSVAVFVQAVHNAEDTSIDEKCNSMTVENNSNLPAATISSARLAQALSEGKSLKEASAYAGFNGREIKATDLLANPSLAQKLREVAHRKLVLESPRAAHLLTEAAANKIQLSRGQERAILEILDRAGITAPRPGEHIAGPRDVAEIPTDELATMLSQAETELAKRARTVDPDALIDPDDE